MTLTQKERRRNRWVMWWVAGVSPLWVLAQVIFDPSDNRLQNIVGYIIGIGGLVTLVVYEIRYRRGVESP